MPCLLMLLTKLGKSEQLEGRQIGRVKQSLLNQYISVHYSWLWLQLFSTALNIH